MAAMAVTCDQVEKKSPEPPPKKEKKNRLIAGYGGSENVT